jgi:hypothetical protein
MEWTPKEWAYIVFAFVASGLSAYGAGRIYLMVVSTEWAELADAICLVVFFATLALTLTGVGAIQEKRRKTEREQWLRNRF